MKHLKATEIHWIKNHVPANREEYLEISRYSGATPVRFPRTVYLEVGAACNLNCTFCSKPTRRKFKRVMDAECLERVVDECAEKGVYSLYCHLFNEPLLYHEQLLPVIARAKEKGIPIVAVTTNGTRLTPEILTGLIDAGLDTLHVSYEGASAEIYREVRGGEVETMDARLREAIEVRNAAGRRNARGQLVPWIAITMMRTRETDEQVEAFVSHWKALVDNVEVRPVLGFLGRIELDRELVLEPKDRIPCRYLGDRLAVAADGTVTGCSVDVDAELDFGNVLDGDTLESIWNSDRYREVWSLHQWQRWDDLPEPCRTCDSWDFLAFDRSRTVKK